MDDVTHSASAGRYPFDAGGPLCDLLNEEDFLFEVYARAGFRQLIKTFCKKHRWPGKPAVPISVGEAQLKSLLIAVPRIVEEEKRALAFSAGPIQQTAGGGQGLLDPGAPGALDRDDVFEISGPT